MYGRLDYLHHILLMKLHRPSMTGAINSFIDCNLPFPTAEHVSCFYEFVGTATEALGWSVAPNGIILDAPYIAHGIGSLFCEASGSLCEENLWKAEDPSGVERVYSNLSRE
jgi:hypothetical protein